MLRRVAGLAVLLVFSNFAEIGHAVEQGVCTLKPPRLHVKRADIFDAQQEQWLGDAMADMVEPGYLLLPADQSTYLTQIGEKLLAQLPPTGVHYTFRVFEAANVRAFSLAGGHIYVSRKMILEARSEDELAAMVAQEIGRVYSRHLASVVTRRLNKDMNVKHLGDKEDVDDKFQRLLNIPVAWDADLTEGERDDDEELADRVGLYALIKAGYAPEAFAAFLDRITLNGGFTGNVFTDTFGVTPEVSVRIRKAHKVVSSLPSACRVVRPPYRPAFKAFQDAMSQTRVNPTVPATPGLHRIALSPPMSPALENVRLGRDGRFALAQDEFQIHVLNVSPPKYLFSIDAQNAEMAQFTPDSASVVFNYRTLRVENWNIEKRQPNGILDFADYIGCLQTSLSPDGNTLACFSLNEGAVWLRLTDLRTGKVIYQNMNFYLPGFGVVPSTLAMRYSAEARQAAVGWSPDGRYFLAASGNAAIGYDLEQHKVIKFGDQLGNLYESRLAFVDSDKLLFECDWGFKNGGPEDVFKMCYTDFPGGRSINTFNLGRTWLASVTGGPVVLTGPTAGSAASILDPATGKLGRSFKLETVDLRGDTLAEEAERGGVSIGRLNGPMQTVALPFTGLPYIEAGDISADGSFLAISDRARGAEWDLRTGKEVAALPPFREGLFDAHDKLEAHFQDHELKPALDSEIDRRTHKVASALSIAAEKIQYGSVLVQYKPLEKDEPVSSDVEIDGYDAASGAKLWMRKFGYNAPALVGTEGDQLLFLMDRRSETANEEIGHHKKVYVQTSDEIREFYQRGLVVEVVDGRSGVPTRTVVAPATAGDSGDDRTAALYGNLLAVHGNRNNTIVYRLSDGRRLMAFFGRALAGDDQLSMIAGTDRPQELMIYDMAGKELKRVTLDNMPLMARFIPAKKELLVLTGSETVYTFDLSGLSAR